MQVVQLKPGDVFEWCGRDVTVIDVQPAPHARWSHRGQGVHVTADVGGGDVRRLHYWCSEHVTTRV